MSKNTQTANEQQSKELPSKIWNLLSNPIIAPIIAGFFLLLIQYETPFFERTKDHSNYSISPGWVGIALFTIGCLFISFLNYIRIFFNSQKYFREEFSCVTLSTIAWSTLAFFISVLGQQMFWYPILAAIYILSNQKLPISRASWDWYALLVMSIILFYVLAFNKHKNWDGLKSTQQHRREQGSEPSGIFSEGIGELERILSFKNILKEYSEIDPNQLLGQLEYSEDSIPQAWEEQARELLRLSSSSYDIPESGWHDRQGCWVGKNRDTGNLIFIYPAQTALSQQDLDNFARYSKGIAESQGCQIGELIVAFRENGEKLATQTDLYTDIRFETEQNLLDKLVNFVDYKYDIEQRVLSHKLPESDLTLNDVYVPSQLLVSEEKRADDNVEDFLRKWLYDPGQHQIALLGEYGQGKSSAALMFTYRLLSEGNQLSRKIPILIELRGKSPRDLRPLELLGAWASQYRIEPQALMRLHIAGRLVLIFEGFDEMALIGNSEMRLRHFRALWKFSYRNTKIIITGRPNFFLDDGEMKAALGINKPIADTPYCEAIRLAPFTVNQIQEALRNQKQLVRDQICSLATRENNFLELVSKPSLLHVVSVLWEKEKLHEKAQLLNSVYVMDRFVRSSYRRQGLKAQGAREFMALNSSERDYFMCGTACYMAAKQLSNQISNEKLNNLIDSLTEAIPESVSTSSSEISGEENRPLKIRIQNPKDDIEHIRTDVRTCGLLVDDPSAPGTFKFGHKSFMEYLFAITVKEYIWNFNQEKVRAEKARAIKKVTNFSIATILDLPVSIDFLAEMIGADTATKQLNSQNNASLRWERATSIRLLEVIFDARSRVFNWLILRPALFYHSYSASLRGRNSCLSFLMRFAIPIIIMFFAYFILIFLLNITSTRFIYLFRLLSPLDSLLQIIIFLLKICTPFCVPVLVSCFLSLSSFSQKSLMLRKFRLWNCICAKLQINDVVLHQIAGTWIVPWARKQSFNYFLNQPKVDKGNESSLVTR